MRKKTGLGTAALAGAAALATTAAAVTVTWTILQGGVKTSNNVGNVIFQNTTSGAVVTCTTSTATSQLVSGTKPSGTDLVTITNISFATPANPGSVCTGPAGLYVKVAPKNLPWKFQATSYDAASGVVRGKATGIALSLESSDGCQADLMAPGGAKGEVELAYTNSTGRVSVQAKTGTGTNLVVTKINPYCDPLMVDVGDGLKADLVHQVTGTSTNWPKVTSP